MLSKKVSFWKDAEAIMLITHSLDDDGDLTAIKKQ